MIKTELAYNYFKNGNTCSQSVLASYCKEFGLDHTLAIKIAHPFGGGIGATGHICGAVAGALMVIGLKYGQTDVNDEDARTKCFSLARNFMNQFQQLHDTIMCHELLEFDKDDTNGLLKAKDAGLTSAQCPQYVKSAAEILENIL